MRKRSGLIEMLKDYERKVISDALINNNYNITHAANELEMNRSNLSRRMKHLSIKIVYEDEEAK